MDDDSPTPLEDSTKDQHSSDSTIQDFASTSEENKSNKSSLFLTILMLIRATSVWFFRLMAKFI